MTAKPRRVRHEAGFTLIELLMAIALTGIILVPMASALTVALRTTDETSNRLAGSNDAQLLSIWLPADVQSTGNLSTDVVATPTANTECSGLTNALRLKWRATETTGTTNTYVAAYATALSSTGDWRLLRYSCVNGGAATTHVIARNLASGSAVAISSSGTRVTMTVTEKATPTDPASYTFSVSGNRRTP
jgi:prepilin-type N-terminal cleavage/methylation domain-containing protein